MSDISWTQIKRDAFLSISRGDIKSLIKIIEDYPKVLGAYDTNDYSLMHIAAEQNNKDILEFLYRKEIDVNIARKNDRGCLTPIHCAVKKDLIDNVIWLLNHGANVDAGFGIHATPLISAAFKGYIEMVKVLLKAGADINACYYLGEGKTKVKIDAIAAAEMKGHSDLVKYLMENENLKNSLSTDIEKTIESQHDEIMQHIEKYLGKTTNTLSEIIPGSKVSVNLHIIPNNDFITIVTTGMSDLPMDDSNEAFEEKFAELIIKLPSSWTINKNDMKDVNNYWPLGWIRKIAHIPHIFDGWIGKDVILPNGEPPQHFSSNTQLSCFMICQPREKGMERLVSSQGNIINFYSLIPIYEEERNVALENGCEYLLRRLNERGITDIVDPSRENVGL